MTTQHTPGPWIVQRQPDCDSESPGAVFDLLAHLGDLYIPVGRFVATNAKYDDDTEEATPSQNDEVNVRLIAAAPAMYALLERLVDGEGPGLVYDARVLLDRLDGEVPDRG